MSVNRALQVLVAATAVVAALELAPERPPEPVAPVRTLALLYSSSRRGEVWANDRAYRQGGLVGHVRAIAEQRARGPTLLVDTGNHFFRDVTFPKDQFEHQKGKSRILAEAMRAQGYDVLCPGGADLAFGLAWYRGLLEAAGASAVCANLRRGEALVFEATTIRTVGGVRIGLFGLLRAAQPLPADGGVALRVEEPVLAARRAVAVLAGRVDAIVALTDQDRAASIALATAVPGIDAILGGYSHASRGAGVRVGRTLIHESMAHGGSIGRLELAVRAGRVDRASATEVGFRPVDDWRDPWHRKLDALEDVRRKAAPPSPVSTDPIFWGNEVCVQCHAFQKDFWQSTRHSMPRWTVRDGKLARGSVGCESCHSPGSDHNKPKMRTRASQRSTCGRCHDVRERTGFDFKRWLARARCPPGSRELRPDEQSDESETQRPEED